jgi:hypothetical protein
MLLAACGGGAETPPVTPSDGAGAPAATDANGLPASSAGGDVPGTADSSLDAATPNDLETGAADSGSIDVAPGSHVPTSDRTPGTFVDALGKQQIIVVLYQPDSIIGDLLLEEVSAASKAVDGTLQLSYTPADRKKYGDLCRNLGLFEAPSVAVVNRSGEIQNFWSGYVGRDLLTHVLTLASKSKKSSVTADDAPAATSSLETAADTAVAG